MTGEGSEMKVQITKCYLVQVTDDSGNELRCEYVFGNRAEAEKAGSRIKEEVEEGRCKE